MVRAFVIVPIIDASRCVFTDFQLVLGQRRAAGKRMFADGRHRVSYTSSSQSIPGAGVVAIIVHGSIACDRQVSVVESPFQVGPERTRRGGVGLLRVDRQAIVATADYSADEGNVFVLFDETSRGCPLKPPSDRSDIKNRKTIRGFRQSL